MAYDEKFRKKAVEYKDSGHTFKQLNEIFGISSSTYYKWKKNKINSGFYVLPQIVKATRRRKIDPDELRKFVKKKPDLFLHEIAEKFNCSAVAIFKRLEQHKIKLKKRRSRIRKKKNLNTRGKNTKKNRKRPSA